MNTTELSAKTLTDRPFPWTCGHCLKKAVYNEIVPHYESSASHDGKSHTFVVDNLELPKCRNCGATVLTTQATAQIDAAFLKYLGLLSPAEIRAGREALGLTQKELAHRLRLADSTISRWENGHQIQQGSMDLLLRLAFNSSQPDALFPSARECPTPADVSNSQWRRQTVDFIANRVDLEFRSVVRLGRMTPEQTQEVAAQLIQVCERMQTCESADGFGELDLEFHQMLCRSARFDEELKLHARWYARMNHPSLVTTPFARKEAVLQDHYAMVEAIRQGKTVECCRAIQDHLCGVVQRNFPELKHEYQERLEDYIQTLQAAQSHQLLDTRIEESFRKLHHDGVFLWAGCNVSPLEFEESRSGRGLFESICNALKSERAFLVYFVGTREFCRNAGVPYFDLTTKYHHFCQRISKQLECDPDRVHEFVHLFHVDFSETRTFIPEVNSTRAAFFYRDDPAVFTARYPEGGKASNIVEVQDRAPARQFTQAMEILLNQLWDSMNVPDGHQRKALAEILRRIQQQPEGTQRLIHS